MGYRKIPTIHTVDDVPGEEGLIVRMQSVSFGKVRQLVKLMDDDTGDEDVMNEIASVFVDKIVSWNLEDEKGVPVPTTLEAVDEQDFALVLGVVNAWLNKITGVGDDLGKDSSSGAKFPGQPVTMEAL